MLKADNISYFHLQGSVNYQKMNPWDRFLMLLLYKSIKRKDPSTWTKDEKGIVGTYRKGAEMTKKKNIEPIVNMLTQ